VKGFDSTIGYTQWAKKPAERDAAVCFPFPTSSLPISSPMPPSNTRHRPPNNSSSRHCVKPAPSSLPRRTYRRPCSPSRARIRYGAVRATHGRPHTQQVAPPEARARCSPWTVPRSALARTSAGAYAFRRVTAASMGSSRAWGVCHTQDPSVRCFGLPLSDAVVRCGVV